MNNKPASTPRASEIQLEVLTAKPSGPDRHPTPLLLVHGAFSSAHIWAPFFLPYFAEHGYEAYAVSLRGHGGGGGRDQLAGVRLDDYVEDVARVAQGLSAPPIIVGTSMGGVVVQKYIERLPATGAVLMASGPPHGMLMGLWLMMLTNPRLIVDMTLMQWLGPASATVASARRALFRPDTPAEYIRRCLPMAEPESPMVALDLLGVGLPSSIRKIDVPVLVLGAERDAFVSQGAVRTTASRYGTRAEIFPGMPHAMMLDPDWRQVAERIDTWAKSLANDPSALPRCAA